MNKRGFTIVELLVVIVVIGILATITIVSYTGISSRATSASLQSDLSNAKTQLALYQVEHSAYPTSPLTVTGNNYCPSPVDDSNYCFKSSSGNTLTYTPAIGSSPQAFSLFASKNTTAYSITNNSSPMLVYATGGTITTDGSYRIRTFTTSGTLTVTTPVTAEVLVVGGGGGGGSSGRQYCGGGGAGGLIHNTAYSVASGTHTITVGLGGNADANGSNSEYDSFLAYGGGAGRGTPSSSAGYAGGSGGGGTAPDGAGGAGVSGQGNNGGWSSSTTENSAGGGGGAGGVGSFASGTQFHTNNALNGGVGLSFAISGTTKWYAAGGGGGANYWGAKQNSIGGGTFGNIPEPPYNNVYSQDAANINGNTNTGSGGGGGRSGTGGTGGSGIVIIRYLTS